MRECPQCGEKFSDEQTYCPRDGVGLVAEGAADPHIGQPVGSYVMTRCLGKGGMGAVYQAEHPSIGSKVAVKFLHSRYASDRAIVDRFFNEARAVNLIGHDNIVKVSDFSYLEDGSPFFIMEFLEGQALTALVGAPRPLEETGPIFLQAADGLQAAHDKGIIHRDLKPDNIFLVTRNRRANFVKIVDFGIAKLQSADGGSSGKTQTGMVMGTAQYMSPEQAGGEVNKIGPASDIYSLGVIMFQLATGQLPFAGNNFGEILVGHLMKPPPSPRSLNPEVPEAYEQVILRCLEKRPEDRFRDMFELYEAIGAVLDSLELSREPPLARPGGVGTSSNPGRIASRPPLATPPASRPGAPRPPSRPGGSTVLAERTSAGTLLVSPDAIEGMRSQAPVAKKKSAAPIIGAVVALLLVGGGAAAYFTLQPGAEPPPPPVAQPKPPEPARPVAEPEPAKPATVTVRLESTPSGAKLWVKQGEKTHEAVTPARLELERGLVASAHLEADGFVASDQDFTPEKDTELRFVMVKAPEPQRTARTSRNERRERRERNVAPPAAQASPPPAPTPAPPPARRPAAPVNVGDGMVDVEL